MMISAGRRQKKKSCRTADTFPRAYGAAALLLGLKTKTEMMY